MLLRVILIDGWQGAAGRFMDMTAPDRTIRVTKAGATPALDSAELFQGGREIVIRHGEELYRLRLTNSNKLILIK